MLTIVFLILAQEDRAGHKKAVATSDIVLLHT